MKEAPHKKIILGIEFFVLFIAIPCLLYLFRFFLSSRVVPFVLILAAVCTCHLMLNPAFDNTIFKNSNNLKHHFKSILYLFISGAIPVALYAYIFESSLFMLLPKTKPLLWFLVLILYPVFAAYPQELIYRAFFFHRYQPLFKSKNASVIVNGIVFGLAHLMYANWLAIILASAGGILFSWRYLTSKSVLIAAIEHAIWGNFLFTIGLGWYFYSGAIH